MSGQNTNIAAQPHLPPSLPPSLTLYPSLSFLQWAKHMCGGGMAWRRKPQTAAAHASFYTPVLLLVFARARNTTLTNRTVQSRLIRLYVLRLSVCLSIRACRRRTVSSAATKARRTPRNREWAHGQANTTPLLPFMLPEPETTVQCHLLPTDFSRAVTLAGRRRGEERRDRRQ